MGKVQVGLPTWCPCPAFFPGFSSCVSGSGFVLQFFPLVPLRHIYFIIFSCPLVQHPAHGKLFISTCLHTSSFILGTGKADSTFTILWHTGLFRWPCSSSEPFNSFRYKTCILIFPLWGGACFYGNGNGLDIISCSVVIFFVVFFFALLHRARKSTASFSRPFAKRLLKDLRKKLRLLHCKAGSLVWEESING